MLRFRDILQFPSFYSKRQNSIQNTEVVITNVKKEEDSINVQGKSKDYTQTIKIFTDSKDIDFDKKIQIHCDCKSFQFEFSHALDKYGSLLFPEKFGDTLNKKPIEKNKYLIASGCKHIIALTNLFLKQKNRFI